MSLETIKEVRGSSLIIKIIGLMDYSTVDNFKVDFPDNINKIVVDLSELDFIDSTGIGGVLSILFEASVRGVSLEFEGLNETVYDLFDIVGVFQIMDTLLKEGKQ
ncbi:STAS domain-containing protein [Paenibacillus frigoriresistens]|uniref:STAS domain-containing protein n=1 Tax=Paenibacillus alginolyticus TaxID=59839 RepID=UPI001565217E|nr:STAS domain-containing protein [Paenibacillus frigoriresistens]NRF95577.1 STAS domain-containing protein [Paenibacillus frigoriresistens]